MGKVFETVKKSSKTEQDERILVTVSVEFLTAVSRSFVSGGRSGHQALYPLNFDLFVIFSNFLKPKVVWEFVRELLCNIFFIVEISHRFTCGEWKLC